MFKTNAHDQRANARLGVQIWHLRADCDHCMSNCLLLTISARMPDLHTQSGIRALIVSTWPECSQREHSSTSILKYALFWVFWTVFYKKIPNAHDQCANARLGVQIWHSRADRDHYMSVPKCSRSACECQIRCADLAFAHWSWPLHVKLSKRSRSARECQICTPNLAFARWSRPVPKCSRSARKCYTIFLILFIFYFDNSIYCLDLPDLPQQAAIH